MAAVREQLDALTPKPAPTPPKPPRTTRPAARRVRKKVAAAPQAPAPASFLEGDTSLLGD
jgi:hypothetical protein